MRNTVGTPWVYLEVFAAVLSAAAWLLMAAGWLPALPLTRAVRATGALLLVAVATGTLLPLLGEHAGPLLAVIHLASAALFLWFVSALGRQFRLASARRRAEGAATARERL